MYAQSDPSSGAPSCSRRAPRTDPADRTGARRERALRHCYVTLIPDQAAATAAYSALPAPYRSVAACRVAVRAPA